MSSIIKSIGRIPAIVITLIFAAAALLISIGIYKSGIVLNDLFSDNKKLKEAITNLTDEGKIGYAKVISQKLNENGKIISTTIKFVEAARDNPLQTVLQKQYTIAGDIVHFDAMIVKFGNKMVMDGRAKSLYLWRRIYGENTPPDKGFLIEEPNAEPQRYNDLLTSLKIKERQFFWSSIWDLANNPDLLAQYDIQAIYGNVTYTKLKKGLIYVFHITSTGQIYPEVVPDI